MRYASWLLSIILHATMFVLLLQHVHLPPADLLELLEVDLVNMEQPEEVVPVLPAPPSPPETVLAKTPPQPPIPEPPVATPLPLDKTIVLDASPPPPAPETVAGAEPESGAEADVTSISPVKVPVPTPAPESDTVKSSAPAPLEESPTDKVVVRKHDIIAHRGHEARFGRTMMADYYSYSSSEFSGQFKARDRTISIIDARKTEYGRFLLYDSKNKTLRRLKESGKYVYTIGPSLTEDEPVLGVVIFLAKDDRIERFILASKDDRIANFPVKVHVREEEVTIPTNDGMLTAYASLPPEGKGHRGVVFVYGDRCVDSGLVLGFTRSLSAENLASLSVVPRWCGGEQPADSEDRLVSDARAALSHFGNVAQVNFRHVGLWGNGPGIPIVIRAASGGALSPAFMVCMLTDGTDPAILPGKDALSRLDMPVLWLVTGEDVGRWQPLVDVLEALRDEKGKRFTIVFAPTNEDQAVPDELMAGTGWVESVAEDHARLAASWIQQMDK